MTYIVQWSMFCDVTRLIRRTSLSKETAFVCLGLSEERTGGRVS